MKKYLARNHRFYVLDSGSWVQISGISNWSVTYENTTGELNKFNNNGWTGSIVTSRSGSINLEGFYLVDASSGLRDYGQFICDSSASQLGYHSLRGFKIEVYDDSSNSIGSIIGSGVFSIATRGGSTTTVMQWNSKIDFKGIPVGSGIYNIFDQEAYPPSASGIDRAGMWTGVLGMYTYAE
jgi:hypothetical protein